MPDKIIVLTSHKPSPVKTTMEEQNSSSNLLRPLMTSRSCFLSKQNTTNILVQESTNIRASTRQRVTRLMPSTKSRKISILVLCLTFVYPTDERKQKNPAFILNCFSNQVKSKENKRSLSRQSQRAFSLPSETSRVKLFCVCSNK